MKALAEEKSPPRDTSTHIDPRNISTTLSILKNPRTGTSNSHWDFRARAVLPENISLLSKCEFKRRDHLSESSSPSVAAPAPATIQCQEGQLQPTLSSLNPVIAHLTVAPDFSVEKFPKKQEIYPHVLGVMSWTKQLSCEPSLIPPKLSPQTGQRIWVKGIVLIACALKIIL